MRKALLVVAGCVLAAAAVTINDASLEAGLKPGLKITGQVIRVEQQVRTENGGTFDRLTVRTRQGEELRLHLGEVGECSGCYKVGDEIRARLRREGDPANQCLVQKMRLRRGGQTLDFRFAEGKMVRSHGHGRQHGSRARDGVNRTGRGGKGSPGT